MFIAYILILLFHQKQKNIKKPIRVSSNSFVHTRLVLPDGPDREWAAARGDKWDRGGECCIRARDPRTSSLPQSKRQSRNCQPGRPKSPVSFPYSTQHGDVECG